MLMELTKADYPLWRVQVEDLLIGNDLSEMMDKVYIKTDKTFDTSAYK